MKKHSFFTYLSALLVVISSSVHAQDCQLVELSIKEAIAKGPRSKLGVLYKQLGDCYAENQRTEPAIEAYKKALSLPFNTIDIPTRLEMATYLSEHQEISVALAEVQKILTNDPTNQNALLLRNHLKSEVKKATPAQKVVQSSLPILEEIEKSEKAGKVGRTALLYKQLGDIYLNEGREDLAFAAYEKAVSYPYETLTTSMHVQIADFFSQMDRLDLSLSQLEKILTREPNHIEALTIKGRTLLWQEKIVDAEKSIDHALSQEPSNPEALLIKADVLLHKGQAAQALPIYQSLLASQSSQKSTFQARYGMAQAQVQLGQLDAAEASIEQLQPKYGYQHKLKTRSEKALQQAKQEPSEKREEEEEKVQQICSEYHEKIAKADPIRDANKMSKYYKELGDCYRNNFKRGEAADIYEKAFSYPNGSLSINDRIDMAEVLGHQDHYPTSIVQLKKVLQVDPKNLRAQILLARILSWDDQLTEAEKYIDEALAQEPKKKEALIIKADILNWSERSDQAMPIYQELLSKEVLLSPDESFDVRYGIALAHFNLGNLEQAKKSLSELKPQYPHQHKKIAKLIERINKPPKSPEEEQQEKEIEREKEAKALYLRSRLKLANDYANCHYFHAAYGVLFDLLKCEPCNPEIHVALGRVYGLQGRYRASLYHLNYAICLEPLNIGAWITKGYVLRWKGDIPGSTCAFNRALEIDCTNFDARIGKGWTYMARGFRTGAKFLVNTTPIKECYQHQDKLELSWKAITGPITDFRYYRYKDSDRIRVDDYLIESTYYRCDWKYNVFYNHIYTSQPVLGTPNESILRERADRVGFNALKMFNACLDVGAGIGYAHTSEYSSPIGNVIANLRTSCGIYSAGSVYDIFTGTAAAIFFNIKTWVNYIEYYNKFNGRWSGAARYYYTKYSDSNHSNKAQAVLTYTLIDAIKWDLYLDYQLTYWNFESQPVSEFVVPGVFGGHGYFNPQDYWSNQLGLLFYLETQRFEMSLRPYGAYASYFVQDIHYYGFLFAGIAAAKFYFTPCFSVGGSIEGGRYPLKNLKYNYSVVTGRVSWVF